MSEATPGSPAWWDEVKRKSDITMGELIAESMEKGASAERARIREAVEDLKRSLEPWPTEMGEGVHDALKTVLSIIKDGDGE